MGSTPRARQVASASGETLPVPNDLWNQMCLTPRSSAARATDSETDGWVTTMTAWIGPGTEAMSA
jgi:hypothetical protein